MRIAVSSSISSSLARIVETPVIAPAARRTCSRSSRFIPRGLPVNLPPLGRGQDSAKRIVLAQTPSLLGIIEQDASDLGPGTPQNVQPFLRRNVSLRNPPRAHFPRMVEPLTQWIALDLLRDSRSHRQAAAIDRLMRLHITILQKQSIQMSPLRGSESGDSMSQRSRAGLRRFRRFVA